MNNKDFQDNVFLKIINREIPAEIVAENEKLIVIKDIYPQASIHLLIIPKNHFINIIDLKNFEIGSEIFKMAKYLSENIENAKEFKLIMNNGYKAGQKIFHAHVHFLSGF